MKRLVLLRHGESMWNRENRADTRKKQDAADYVVGNTRSRRGLHRTITRAHLN